jgi:hypothetical protein
MVDPESDTKQIFIPSPPSLSIVKIHPRAAVFLMSSGKEEKLYEQIEVLKTYAQEQNVMLICPFTDDFVEFEKSFCWIDKKRRVLNIDHNRYSVMGCEGYEKEAKSLAEYLANKYDVALEYAGMIG